MFSAVTHKNLMNTGMVFHWCPLRNRSPFPVASTGDCGRKLPNAFCFILKLLPVCLRVGFQLDGQNEMKDCSHHEQSLLKNS